MKKILSFLFMITITFAGMGQTLSGFVMDRDNNPIPYSNVYFQKTSEGTTSNSSGYYFYQLETAGFYKVVYTAVGYKDKSVEIAFKVDEDIKQNIYLDVDVEELNEAVIKSKRKDPAYGIIQEAIKRKSNWNNQYAGYSCNVYLKATEIISEKEKKKRQKRKEQKQREEEFNSESSDSEEDIFDKERRKQQAILDSIAGGMNMVEVQMQRHFQVPDQVKEIRNGYKKYGDALGLYFTSTTEDDFNFYDNLMSLDNLNEVPIVSPLHSTSVLTYKFSLENTNFIDGQEVFEIKVTPRKKGNAVWSGTIWIQNDIYCIRKVDLTLSSDAMIVFKEFNVKQDYMFNDSILVVSKQEFTYLSKDKGSVFRGVTNVDYTEYVFNPEVSKKFFSNEVAVTTQEAYDKDSLYWDRTRPQPLTVEEQRFQFVKDSLYAVMHSNEYLDSLDREENKIGPLEVLILGITHSNRAEKKYWGMLPMAAMVNPFSIGGYRIMQGGNFFKLYENKNYFAASGDISYGVRNEDVKGTIRMSYRFDPMKQGVLKFGGGNFFNIIASNGAITNIFERSNWIEEKSGYLELEYELFNGLMIEPRFEFKERLSANRYKLNPDFDSLFVDNRPRSFETYQASLLSLELSYTPFQKFMREPHQKIILGSKWPTFYLDYTIGLNKLFGSDVDHDYLLAGIRQTFKLGTLGTSTYNLKSGKFLHTRKLPYEDSKIFPRGDVGFFGDPMNGMQLQDVTLVSNDLFVQGNYSHNFNGAIINYIPLIRRLKISFSAGVSGIWIKDQNYQYAEAYAGIHKSFRVLRYRYRLGFYYVQAVTPLETSIPGFKIGINRYNVKDKSWE